MVRRIILSIFLIAAFLLQTHAQAFQWARQFAAHYSAGTDIVTDNNLNVISAGWFQDSVDLDPGPGVHWVYENVGSVSYNSYLSKLDANGAFVWGYSYDNIDTSSYTRIYSIDVDNQDNIIVIGQFRDSVDLDLGLGVYKLYGNTNVSSSFWDNIFIAKYDPNGSLIWGKGLHSSNGTTTYGLWAHGLKVDASNNVIISGRFYDTVDFDPGPGVYNLVGTNVNSSVFYGNKFLLKLSPAGNFTWVRDWQNTGSWNNSGWYGSNELDVDQNDNIFFPIVFSDSMDIDPLSPISMIYSQGLRDISLCKVSPTGNLVWHKEIGGSGHDYCHSLATDPSGNIFYTIRPTSNPIDMDPGPGIYMVTWVASSVWGKVILKLDNNGNFIWALKNMDNTAVSSWYGEGIATDTSGALYLTTRIFANSLNNNQWDLDPGPGAFIINSAGGNDIAFQNLDGNGQFIWGGAIGGAGHDWGHDVCTDKARGVYITGYFDDIADFDPTPNTSLMTATPSSFDAFVVKLNNCNKVTSQIHQACDSVLYKSQYYYTDTIIQSHFPAWNGCDSAHSDVIDIKTYTNDTIVVDTCKYYIWNNTTYTATGVYTHNFGIPSGCDSLVTLVLTIGNGSVQSINLADCDSVNFNGMNYSQPGLYQQNYTDGYGCDSIFLINFTKIVVDTSITSSSTAQSLLANASNATYQWIDCSTMQPVPNGTGAYYFATQSGSYACIITQNGCTDTSACYTLTYDPNAVQDYNIMSKLYPNPSSGNYQLELDKEYKDVQLEIRMMNGQVVWKKNYHQLKETSINLDCSSGVYMLYIKQGTHTQIKKLLKW